jgi:hypothetical protein
VLAVATIVAVLALLDLGLVRTNPTVPAVVTQVPLAVAQYFFWRRRGPERITREYLQAERMAPALVPAPIRERV